jgi:glucan endo-1,3-alpha-glucosidase
MLDPPNSLRRSLRLCLLVPFALLLSWVISPAQAQKRVFAQYMVTNQDYQGDTDSADETKIADYERQIQQAQAVGLEIY